MKRKIIIQGANQMGKWLSMRMDSIFDILAFIDRDTSIKEKAFEGIPMITDLDILHKYEYDFIFVLAEDFCGVQREYHNNYGVPYEKMISMRHTHQWGKQASFCAFANEIYYKNIAGSIAEVGVDFGDTAKYLNLFFSDRKLFLFDTFTGFHTADIEKEREAGTMVPEMEAYYNRRSTAPDVLRRMFYPDQCFIREGYFPASLNGLEDTFAFVHIDCDLQAPILSALEYFFPRLSEGGYICVHDYFNPRFPGVRKVLREFSEKHKISFSPDMTFSGAVILK